MSNIQFFGIIIIIVFGTPLMLLTLYGLYSRLKKKRKLLKEFPHSFTVHLTQEQFDYLENTRLQTGVANNSQVIADAMNHYYSLIAVKKAGRWASDPLKPIKKPEMN